MELEPTLSSPDSQFQIDGYQCLPYRNDKNKNVGGKTDYEKK